MIHYFADYLILAPLNSDMCKQFLHDFLRMCNILSIPVAMKKVEGPLTMVVFSCGDSSNLVQTFTDCITAFGLARMPKLTLLGSNHCSPHGMAEYSSWKMKPQMPPTYHCTRMHQVPTVAGPTSKVLGFTIAGSHTYSCQSPLLSRGNICLQ